MDWTDYVEVEERFFREHGREPTPEELEEFALDGACRQADMMQMMYQDRGIP